jgi:serine/threonine-protein kinase HipA
MRLHVCLEGQVAAVLDSSRSHTQLTYSESWLNGNGAYPLSQSLPLVAEQLTGAPVVNFMWGLLPDNERTLDAWGRRFQVSARDPAALLAHVV